MVLALEEAHRKWKKMALLHVCEHVRTGRKAAASLGCEWKTFWVAIGNTGKEKREQEKQPAFRLVLPS